MKTVQEKIQIVTARHIEDQDEMRIVAISDSRQHPTKTFIGASSPITFSKFIQN